MPGLVAFGRRWEFGSDDLFFPGFVSVAVHGTWLLGMLGGVVYFRTALGCEPSHYLVSFSSSFLFLTLCGILLDVAMTILSARGSILDDKPRRPIIHLIHMRLVVLILEMMLLIIGTVFVFKSQEAIGSIDCPDLSKALTMMQVVVAAYWIAFLMLILVTTIYVDPCHCYSAKVDYRKVTKRINDGNIDQEVVESQWKLSHTAWEKRFKVLCCLVGSDDTHQRAYREVAEIFAHLFYDRDVVMSDIAAGFALLQKEEIALDKAKRSGRQPYCGGGGNDEELPFDFKVQEDRELFQDLVHFMKFAIGMYSWPMYVYMNPLCGLCQLYSHLNCCRRRNEVEQIHNDNNCSCYMGGLRQITGLDEIDVVYVSFENDIYKVPFMVCRDHETKSVVIAYRGTLSFGDIMTDFTARTRPIELKDFPNFQVHKGMLKTVTATIKKLDEEDILGEAFRGFTGYKLVVVGHSLGSGCACLTALLLRTKYPDVKCFCYSPTGALVNEAAAKYTEEFVTSITLGKDMVARFNVPNTHKLKEDIGRVIRSCQKPKCQILMGGCMDTFTSCFGGFGNSEVVTKSDDDPVNTAISIETDTNNEGIDHVESSRLLATAPDVDPEPSLEPLFPPGKILHLIDNSITKPCFCASRQLEVKWASRHDFNRMSVSPDMIRDHFPDVLMRAMNKIWNKKLADVEDSAVEDSEIRRSYQKFSN